MRKNIAYWLVLLVFAGCVLALNYWCLPAHDELAYTFQGECTPMVGVAHHVQNLKDVIGIQIADYRHGPNGRVFLHSLVVLFSGWELYTLFDFCNTAMWFLLVWLVMREGGVKVDSVRKYVLGATLSFLFLWYSEMCCYNAAFAVNYLWTACLTIGFMNLWRKHDAWWMLPICFVYGWWMEVFSMPMIAALGCCGLIFWWRTHRFPWSVRRCLSMGLMFLGGVGCCGSHLVSGRAAESGAHGSGALLVEILKAQLSLFLGVWPIVLVIGVAAIIWFFRRRLVALYDSSPDWWMYFVFGAGVYLALGKEGMRMAYPMFLAGTILMIKNRNVFSSVRRAQGLVVAFVAVWMPFGAMLQYRIGMALNEMETVYAKDPQGVTYRRAVAVGPWRATVSIHQFNKWHRSLYKHKYRHQRQPVVLSPHLYETLYETPPSFFAEANRLAENLYVDGNEKKYVVQKGDGPLSVEDKNLISRWLASGKVKTGWRKYLPGRFRQTFPASDFYMALPTERHALIAKDGNVYVIHTQRGD